MIKGADRLEEMYFSPVRAVMEKMAKVRATGADVVSFGPGEPDFNTPSQIKEETIKAIEANVTHYPPNRGYLELRQEISKYLEKLGGVKYDPETEIIVDSKLTKCFDPKLTEAALDICRSIHVKVL